MDIRFFFFVNFGDLCFRCCVCLACGSSTHACCFFTFQEFLSKSLQVIGAMS